jgi:hypothetical protein
VKAFHQKLNSTYISKKILKIARDKYREKILQIKLEQSQKFKPKIQRKFSEKLVECNKDWPLCIQFLEKSKIVKVETEFFVFRQADPPMIIGNYFVEEKLRARVASEDIDTKLQNTKKFLVIGRHEHICNGKSLEKLLDSEEDLKNKGSLLKSNDVSYESNNNQGFNFNNLQSKIKNISVSHRRLSKAVKHPDLDSITDDSKNENFVINRRRSISFCAGQSKRSELEDLEGLDSFNLRLTYDINENVDTLADSSLNKSHNDIIFPQKFEDFCKVLSEYKKDEQRNYDALMNLFPLAQGWNPSDLSRVARSSSIAFVKNLDLFKLD